MWDVPKHITLSEIRDILNNNFNVNKKLSRLKFEVHYRTGSPWFPIIEIRNDRDLSQFISETSKTKVPLCVTRLDQDYVPDFDEERRKDVAYELINDYPDMATQAYDDITLLERIIKKPDLFSSGTHYNLYQRFVYRHVPIENNRLGSTDSTADIKNNSLGSTDSTADIENNSLGGTHTVDLENQETPKRRCLHDDVPTENTSFGSTDMADKENQETPKKDKFVNKHTRGGLYDVISRICVTLWERTLLHVPDAKRLKDDKVKHTTTIKLLERICEKVDRTHTSSDIGRLYSSSFCVAVENNTAEAIRVMTTYFPDALLTQIDWAEILKLTVLNHSQKVYSFLLNLRRSAKYAVVLINDYDDESTILHLAGRLAPIQKLIAASGAALQMQQELQWDIMAFIHHHRMGQNRSHHSQTPMMVFRREHEKLRKEGEEWMKKTADSYTITAALIITIVFAAAITIPGGNDIATGKPIYETKASLIIFAISDAISLFTSTTSLLLFLSILTARYAHEDFLYKLPKRLIFGLVMLFLSVTSMMIAFGATLYIMFGQEKQWIRIPIVALACLPIASFMTLQFPLLHELISSTYGHGMFGKQKIIGSLVSSLSTGREYLKNRTTPSSGRQRQHYEDILPIIMEKVRHDRRKDVHTRLDFGEGTRERIREDSYYSNVRARATEPGWVKVQDRLKYDSRHKKDSRDSPQGRNRTRPLRASRDGRHKDSECLRSTRESYGDSFSHSLRDRSHHHHMKRKRDKSPPSSTYDDTGDPEDHVKVFQAAAQVERWAMPTWCHMFNSNLIGAARVWFDELPPESIDGYKDLRAVFLAYFMQQKKYVKDQVEIHNIKQRDGETIKDFMECFKIETGRMKGASECMRISGFMHEVNNPELTKHLNEHVPKTMEEMMITTTAFIRGEAATASKKKGHVSWKPHDQSKRPSSDKRSDFRGHPREGRGANRFTPLAKTPKEILAIGAKIKQGRDQSKTGKKETAAKDKPTAIYMVQSWQRTVKQKVTQSFERVREIVFPQLAASNGTEGPFVIEAEMGGHMIHRMYIDGCFSMEILYEHYFNRLWPEIKRDATHSTRAWMNFMVVKSMSPYNGIIGRPGLKAIQAVPSTVHGMLKFLDEGGIATIRITILIPTECASVTTSPVIPGEERSRPANFTVAFHLDFPDQEVVIGRSLSDKGRTELCSILKKNLDIFVWQPSDMTEVPRSVAKHRLNIREGYSPVRQKKGTRQGYTSGGPKTGRRRNHEGRLLSIAGDRWKVETLCGYPFKCFLDAYKGYHQIQLAEANEEKTTFHTRQEVYCYTKMPFGLKNAGVTYQRLMDKAFESQVGWNIEVYVDEQVVKSYTEAEMMRDIEETFRTLRKVNMKLNPKKCSFGLTEGVFLGYVITPEGIKPCPKKTTAVLQLPSPRTIKEVQSLNGTLASLNRFLSKSAEKSLPQFQTLKKCIKKSDFRWTAEAEQAFQQLKQHLSELPLLVAPKPQEELIMYLSATYGAVSAVLMTERGTTQTPIYFIRRAPLFGRAGEGQIPDSRHGLLHEVDRSKGSGKNSRRTGEEIRIGQYCMPLRTEAVIPTEIGMPTYRTAAVDVVNNDEQLRLNLDLLEERRERAAVCEARAKSKMMKYYNARVHSVAFKPVPHVKRLKDDKVKHNTTIKLLRRICEEVDRTNTSSDIQRLYSSPFCIAVENNTDEAKEKLTTYFAVLYDSKKDGHNIYQLIVLNRSEKVYIFIMNHKRDAISDYMMANDIDDNNILHLAGRLAPIHKLNAASGAALQMQQELQWFEEVKRVVGITHTQKLNKRKETLMMVFRREHEKLRKEGEEWMKKTADSYTITAALIITIAFAVAIIIPGGNDSGTGKPIYETKSSLIIFSISDAVSLFTSTTSLLLSLSILTARYADEDFLYKLPKRLTFAFEERNKSQDTLEANDQDKLLMASSNNQSHGKGRGKNFNKEANESMK
nr:reverse transcriptase domain-containing protein [Tanacetum cinerariifolium]